jgi:hypothetical protein
MQSESSAGVMVDAISASALEERQFGEKDSPSAERI